MIFFWSFFIILWYVKNAPSSSPTPISLDTLYAGPNSVKSFVFQEAQARVYWVVSFSGIVTRCPLELRLKSRPEKSEWMGRISYQKLSGERVIKELGHPSRVGEEVNRGKLPELQEALEAAFPLYKFIGKHVSVFPTAKAKKDPNSVTLCKLRHSIRH